MYRVYLKKGEEKGIYDGRCWVYANEAAKIETDGKSKNGDIAAVYTSHEEFIGRGYINHLSKILVRLLTYNREEEINKDFFKKRITAANELRKKLGYSDCYRVVFGDADGLSGLICDKYGDVLSIQLLSLGMELQKQVITECLVEIFHPRGIYERSDVPVREKEGLTQKKELLYGNVADTVITENGLRLQLDIENGQKTGYFLDQKENRFAIRRYCRDMNVLDCFSNSGGFALNAALAGAKSVTALDISQAAVDTIHTNAAQNGLQLDAMCVDVFEQLRIFYKEKRKFDVIILDPPAFCKTADQIRDAYRGYKDINVLAMKLLNSGGFLVSCSCSHYMSTSLLEDMLTAAGKEARKTVRCLERRAQSPDHPVLLGADETLYLKFYIMQVTDKYL